MRLRPSLTRPAARPRRAAASARSHSPGRRWAWAKNPLILMTLSRLLLPLASVAALAATQVNHDLLARAGDITELNSIGYTAHNQNPADDNTYAQIVSNPTRWDRLRQRMRGLVIGGLQLKSEYESKSKFPILGDFPVIGLLFTSTKKSQVETETLIFITPKIVYPGK